MSGNTVGTFFKNRMKSTKLHVYSATGDLVTKDRSGAVISTITIPTYRPPTEAEVATMESDRLERIKTAQVAFEAARRTMRSMIAEGNTSNIRRAMADVTRADTLLQRARYAEKFVHVTSGAYEVRQIDFEDPRNTSKTVNPGLLTGKREPIIHFLFQATPFSLEDIWCRVATPEEAATAAATATTATAVAARAPKTRAVLVISEPTGDTGFMSSFYPSIVMCRGRTYRTAYQAILGELAIVFNEPDVAEDIRTTRDVTEISFTVEDAEEATEEAWNRELDKLLIEVNRDKFSRSPERAELLLNTGRAILGYVPPEDPTDTFQGIGLDADNPDATNFKSWTGQNKFGIALGVIRKELLDARKGLSDAPPSGGAGGPGGVRTAVLKRKPVGAKVTAAAVDAASAVADAATGIASTASAAASTAAGAVSRTAGAVADSLAALFTPIATAGPVAGVGTPGASVPPPP
jgi:ribA/ribD-fused uncharacterized protein